MPLNSALLSAFLSMCSKNSALYLGHRPCIWEGNKQEGQGSPKGRNRLQVPDIFLSSGRKKQTSDIFFFSSLYKFERRFLLKCCVAKTPGFTSEANYSQTLS